MNKTCANCGIEFYTRDKRPDRGKYCSVGCVRDARTVVKYKRTTLREIKDGYARFGLHASHSRFIASSSGFRCAHPLMVLLLSRQNLSIRKAREKYRTSGLIGFRQSEEQFRETVLSALISLGFSKDYLDGFIRGFGMEGLNSPLEQHILGFEDGTAARKHLL